MRVIWTVVIAAILCMGFLSGAESMAGVVNTPPELVLPDQQLDGLQYLTLQDAVSGTKNFYGSTPAPEYQPLEVHRSDDPQYDYMAQSPYYKAFFKGRTLKVKVKGAWVEFELAEDLNSTGKAAGPQPQGTQGESKELQPVIHQNSLSVSDVFESVDLSYKVDTSLFTETFTLKEWRELERIVYTVSWGGMTPEYQEDGSILFLDENGKELLRILPPFMEDATGFVCTDLHYAVARD